MTIIILSFYSDKKYIYSVNMLIKYVKKYKKSHTINLNDFKGNKMYEKPWDYSIMDVFNNPKKYKKDYERIINADLRHPIIIFKNNIIDGWHRFAKALLLNKKQIKVYSISKKELDKFIITKNTKRGEKYADNLTLKQLNKLLKIE